MIIQPQSRSITLLDTPGFQTLEKNSFNQLVINLTSEKTQEILVDNRLKEKQEEFVREGFQWVKVDTRGVLGNIFDGIEKVGLHIDIRSAALYVRTLSILKMIINHTDTYNFKFL